jgi:hypothetical protein
MMASSSEKTPDVATSLDSCGTKDLRNHSRRNAGGISTLIKLFRCLHSVPVSYLAGNWKWLRKAITSFPKEEYLEHLSSMYHLATLPMRVR